MSINFIPNDPLVTALPMRRATARPDRRPDRAGFEVGGADPQAIYQPGSTGFLRWQSRQAAILAVQAWERVLGVPLPSWAPDAADAHRLPLLPDAGDDVNAYYDRQSVSFFHHQIGADVVFSGSSTDVVSHEVGHAILDAARPDLWFTNFIEVGGFHEAFGDVTAILTALSDRRTRVALLGESPDLGTANDIEATAEQLSDAIRRIAGPTHPASKPRHALNTFVWQLPSTMPRTGGPDVMIAEVHSIARIMSGAFYDVLRGVLAAGADHSEAGLWKAARLTGRLFHKAARTAPQVPRFFQSVGRAMVLADQQAHGGANREIIRDAFGQHGIVLGTGALLSPEVALAGPPPVADVRAAEAEVAESTRRDLRQRLGVPRSTAMVVTAVDMAGGLAKVKYRTPVPLDGIHDQLAGVVAMADVQVLVGESGGAPAVLGAMPHADLDAEAVREFAASLVANEQVDLGGGPRSRRRRGAVAAPSSADRRVTGLPTHHIATRGRARVLERARFACPGC